MIKVEWNTTVDILTEIGHLLNSILFIGGYNSQVQQFIADALLEVDSTLLEYFELSYLLYRNIESTRYTSKVEIVSEMGKEALKKLFKLYSISQEGIVRVKGLELEKILAPGQLVLLLRLFTNMVHINHKAQIPFEKDSKYIHMIMSLTHDSATQATMKEWAIMFIRNVSEWSEILRDEMGKIKMEIKVE